MNAQELFTHLRQFDTPTICNALEVASGKRELSGFTQQTLIAASPDLPSIIGFARTATIRCTTPYDADERRSKQLAYYEYVAKPDQPSIAVVQDIDERPGLGAFWGEVNTHVHFGLGCVGTLTNGSQYACPLWAGLRRNVNKWLNARSRRNASGLPVPGRVAVAKSCLGPGRRNRQAG